MHKVTSNTDKWSYELTHDGHYDRDLTFELKEGEIVVTASNSNDFLELDMAMIYLSIFQAESLRDWLTEQIQSMW